MSSPTQSSEPNSPNTQVGAASATSTTAAPGRPGADGKRPIPDVVGIDGIKVYDEEFKPLLTSSCEDKELDGVSTFLPMVITKFVERVLLQYNAKKLCVVFDGLFLPMSLKEKEITEDVIMAMAMQFNKLEQEVMFAPYLASAQLEALKHDGHVQALYKVFPHRVPIEFIKWNESDDGLKQPNIYKYVLNLVSTTTPYMPENTKIAALMPIAQDNNSKTEVLFQKFLERFSALDERGYQPLLSLLQCSGVISPRLARALAHRTIENDNVNPEDDTQTALYEFMSVLLPLRAQIVHQLIANVPTYPEQNRIVLKWDNQNFNTTPPIITLDNWSISNSIKGTNGPRAANHLHFVEPWEITDVLRFENNAVSVEKYEEVTIHTLVPTVILRSLDLMGYFTHAQEEEITANGESNCSIYGEALKQFQRHPHLSEAAVLFIELVRTHAFTSFRNVLLAEIKANAAEGSDDAALDDESVSDAAKNERTAEDIAIKIATLIPCASLLKPEKTAEKYDLKPHAQFIKAAQAHARSLRMLLEASAGNVILREIMNLAMYNPPEFVPHEYSLAGATDILPTVAAALPFGANPPSARSFFMFSAIREYGHDEAAVEKIAAEFSTPKEKVEADVQNMKAFVQNTLHARNHLSVRDDDVGLDPFTLEVIEPALKYLCQVVGVQYEEPVPFEDPSYDEMNNNNNQGYDAYDQGGY